MTCGYAYPRSPASPRAHTLQICPQPLVAASSTSSLARVVSISLLALSPKRSFGDRRYQAELGNEGKTLGVPHLGNEITSSALPTRHPFDPRTARGRGVGAFQRGAGPRVRLAGRRIGEGPRGSGTGRRGSSGR